MKVLRGVKVLDLGSFITAPYAAMLLADMGADVVKVEKPGVGDPFRSFKGGLYSGPFQGHNRNKRSITLDLTMARGREVLDLLVTGADVLVVNNRPGVEEKLGIGAERLQKLNPRLVYCSITGFGATGPYAQRPAYDTVGQTLSGWLSMFHRGGDSRIAGPAVSDALSGMFACMGLLGALLEREQTGIGRKVEVSMLEATVAAATEPMGNLSAGEAISFYSRGAASQAFIVTCKDGKRIGVHMSSPTKFWEGLARSINREDLLVKYPDRSARVRHYDELALELERTFLAHDREYWLPLLEKYDVPFAPERHLSDLSEDPQVQHLGMLYEMIHPKLGKVTGAHRPIRYDGDNNSAFSPPPALGEHTDEVLMQAGLSAKEIENLRVNGVI